MTHSTAAARVTLLLASVALLAGCASPVGGSPDSTAEAARAGARESAAALADQIGTERPEDIDEVAREAVAQGAVLVGIERLDAPELIDPFGALTTRSFGADGEPYCFRIEYGFYGRHSDDGRTVYGTTTGVQDVDCDRSTPSVTPPPDTRAIVVTAVNAEAASTEVLSALPEDPGSADAIAAAIAALLEAPTGEREVAAQPYAVVRGADVGVSIGSADDCVLVKRESGMVSRVYAPAVLLQPGEYGCGPETALLPAESLRPPH